MPYKEDEDRKRLLIGLLLPPIGNASDLSYVLARVVQHYLKDKRRCWDTYSDVVKAVDSMVDAYKAEVLLPYEAIKREENGKVF